MNRAPKNLSLNRGIIFAGLLAGVVLTGVSGAESPAWGKKRSLDDFRKLLERSPFSLPTAETSSPLAERYALTGVVTIGGDEEVFVFDRTDQSRSLLTKKPNDRNMSLVSLVREGDSHLKASIRVGGEEGTIGFLESTQPKGVQAPAPPAPGSPAAGPQPAQQPGQQAIQSPVLPQLPQLPQQPGAVAPNRRIIRRPVVAPPQQSPHP
jgi:hypothetical protein